jgi:hypothetical protein
LDMSKDSSFGCSWSGVLKLTAMVVAVRAAQG